MKNKLNTTALLTFVSLLTFSVSNCTQPKHRFKYAKPETLGFSSQKLETLSSFLSEAGSSAMILMVDGKVIFEWGKTDMRHTIHSIRKPMINALYGIKIAEGIIDTSMTLRELNIDDIKPALSEDEKNARIADLLKSRSGVYHDAAAVSKGMLHGKPARNEYKPGEHYYYNNWDFNVLGSILEQETGKSIYNMFKEEIAIPLGMHDYTGSYTSGDFENWEDNWKALSIPETDGFYQYEKSKSKYPAYHFRLSARDMALFGQLYLNNGNWEGHQIISKEWIKSSTKAYSVYSADYGIAYGMLWRVLMKTETRRSVSYFHTGVGIHMLGIYPSIKLVLVHRVDTEKEYSFNQKDFYKMIGLVFEAKMD